MGLALSFPCISLSKIWHAWSNKVVGVSDEAKPSGLVRRIGKKKRRKRKRKLCLLFNFVFEKKDNKKVFVGKNEKNFLKSFAISSYHRRCSTTGSQGPLCSLATKPTNRNGGSTEERKTSSLNNEGRN